MSPAASTGPVPGRPRILVVEDERPIRLLLDKGLSSVGYAIHTAAGGREALAAFQAAPFDLVITDVVMPGMTGWELVNELRALDIAVPIIVFSAYGRTLEEEAAKRGVVLLHKPQQLHEIARVVGQALTAVRLGRPALALLPELNPAIPG